MLYALEWYEVPKTAYINLVGFHPYLTEKDCAKLYEIKKDHLNENCISLLLFALLSNRLLTKKAFFQSRLTRIPATLFLSGCGAYLINKILLQPLMLQEMEEIEFKKKYFTLDLNENMMRHDLKNLGIYEKDEAINK